ncbi:MAG: HAMP domain-containing histidine kinase [Erysipelotrichia bacterium]|nr:HAMP domain-containing histidine kinase [Erysipelotrichia bacterium]
MSQFANQDCKHLFATLYCLCTVFVIIIQICLWLTFRQFSHEVLIASLAFSINVHVCFRKYFIRQQQILDEAAAQLDRFAGGDNSARIESDEEGSFAKLFHTVNQMTTKLSADAEQEQQKKVFLQNTISDISHQIKTPLAALEIYNTLLQDEKSDPEAVAVFSTKSGKEIERIEMLIQSLLKITRLDSGSIIMNRQTENIAELMREVKAHFDLRAEQEQKQLILFGPEDTALLCDRVWFIEAINNLVKNAFDHTKENDRIEIQWRLLPSITQITVKDTGSGIYPEDIYHIFKRFYRSRYSKDTQGLGLGLPLVKSIVEAHDGVIEVDSILGKGATFTMNFLPLTKL